MVGGKPIQNNSKTQTLPASLYYYRRWLGALDHHDRQLHAYYSKHRNIKWHCALLMALLKICVNNTWIVTNQLELKLSLKEVEEHIIKHLSGTYTLRQDTLKPVPALRYDHVDHWSESFKKGPCVLCLTDDKHSNTSYRCSKCKVRLHVLCFQKYHLE